MSKKKLAIIGASYLQLPIVEKAKKLDIETHCFAWEDAAVCKTICDYFYPISILEKEKILDICKQKKIDGITTIATDMAVPTICYVAESMGLVTNSYKSSLICTNKGLMRDAFDAKGIKSPKYLTVNEPLQTLTGFKLPLIVKPVDRSGSRGVKKIEDFADLNEAVRNAIEDSFSKNAIVEEFVEGKEISVESISWKGKHYILAITDKVTTGNPHFVELSHHQPSTLPQSVQDKIRTETIKVLDALNIEFGAGHAEFKITSTGEVFVIEVGARMGGDFIGSHLVELSTGYDFIEGVIDVALNKFKEPKTLANMYSGIYFLCEETKSLLPYFKMQTDFIIQKEILSEDLKSVKNSNDRSGYFIYRSSEKIDLLETY